MNNNIIYATLFYIVFLCLSIGIITTNVIIYQKNN